MTRATVPDIVDVLRAFAALGELGRGLAPGHGERASVVALAIADALALDDAARAAAAATTLLFHAGCTAGSSHFAAFIAADELVASRDMLMCDPGNFTEVFGWIRRHVATGAPLPVRLGRVLQFVAASDAVMAEVERGCSEVGALVADRFGLPPVVGASLRSVCETWQGRRGSRMAGEAIPLPTRIAQAAVFAEMFGSDGGPDRARDAVAQRAGRSLDPAVARAFASVAAGDAFFRDLDDDPGARLLDACSLGPAHEALIDAAARALADVTDLKSPATAAHCRSTGSLAAEVARDVGWADGVVAQAARAGYVHDVGKVGVPCSLLEQRRPRSRLEEERLGLHVALGVRILSCSEALRPLAPLVASHHAEGDHGPVARLLAVVDGWLEERDSRTGPPSERSADAFVAVRRAGSDPGLVDALEAVVAREGGRRAPRGPADLSEREQEVLALVARGLTNKEIGRELRISAHTVRHHLENVYQKIDVTSRAGATLFAAEHGFA